MDALLFLVTEIKTPHGIHSITNTINLYYAYLSALLTACDVTLSVYTYRAGLKNMPDGPDNGGNRTCDLWNISPMLCSM
jgi:hypothetical protein